MRAVPDPLAAPTWITAIATAVLAVFAIITAIFAIKAFRKQSAEVGLLQKQAEREAEERRWAQATLVYVSAKIIYARSGAVADDAAAGPITTALAVAAEVHNTSEQPVYDSRIHWVVKARGGPVQAGAEVTVGTLAPGGYHRNQREVPDGTAADRFIPVAYFRDARGLRCTVLPDGHLAPVAADLVSGEALIATTAVEQAAIPPAGASPAAPTGFRAAIGRLLGRG
jgi:hypothetical protein